MATYTKKVSPIRFLPVNIKLAIIGCVTMAVSVILALPLFFMGGRVPMNGPFEFWYTVCVLLLVTVGGVLILTATLMCKFLPDSYLLSVQVRRGLYDPAYGNPLHLREGERLPRIRCKSVGEGRYELTISAQQAVDSKTIVDAAPSISSALNHRFWRYAITRADVDKAYNSVTFLIKDVIVDRSLTFNSVEEMQPESPSRLRVDKDTYIDLTTSGSMLVAGKTRSGKTTGILALLLQVLLCGRDNYGSEVVIIDPKQAELSRLSHTVTLDEDGEAHTILDTLQDYAGTITKRQRVLNDLSEKTGDAVKWWDAGMSPSFLFIDEFVALRAVLPKKPEKGSDYCVDAFDALLKRIITMGASAGCFVIVSIAEASVQEGGLPSMLRSAMSTRVLFRPTMPEGRLIWDAEKLTNFSAGRVYGPGDAWFSSTDGEHEDVSFVHFPCMDFAVYRELGRLVQAYYAANDSDTTAPGA